MAKTNEELGVETEKNKLDIVKLIQDWTTEILDVKRRLKILEDKE
jgi:hypothetical protein